MLVSRFPYATFCTPSIGVVCCTLLIAPGIASAHVVSFEPEAKLADPSTATPADDYSLDSPRILENVVDSLAIHGFLHDDDVDWYEFTLGDNDVPEIVSVLALSPACEETRDQYVNVALLAAHLPAADPATSLPFELPDGFGIEVPQNPEVPADAERPVFYEPSSGNFSFLPLGVTNDCIWNEPWACDWSHTIGGTREDAGRYLVAVWTTTGEAADYVLSVGMSDANYYVSEDEALVANNAWLHFPCTVIDGGIDTAAFEDGDAQPEEDEAAKREPGCSMTGQRSNGGLLVLSLLGLVRRRRRRMTGVHPPCA
jgi:MYXO-CTERM domain-containing protein